MMKSICKIVVAFVFFSGCTSNDFNGRIVDGWPEPVRLEGTSILDHELGLLYVSLIDTLLAVVADRDTLIHIYDKDLNHISSFGNKGRGPGEFTIPPIIQDVKVEGSKTTVLVHHQMGAELLSIDITASAEQHDVVISQRSELPGNLRTVFGIFYLPNGGWAGIYDDRSYQSLGIEKRVGFYADAGSSDITIFPLYNLEIEPYDRSAETNLNARLPAMSPDRSKMAVVMRSSPKLEIFEVGSTTPERFTLDTPPGYRFDLEDYMTGNHVHYYTYMSVTDDYIYLLYSGHKANETGADQKIRVMDWDGNPKAQYLIPAEYDLVIFDVDEENRQIYGSSFNNDSVYIFDYYF
ncbi:MAG: hypothetical protein JJU13_00005 [Balneolaceae bacterium]|nr:hypothetical protein [Balneolaceae bacterium]